MTTTPELTSRSGAERAEAYLRLRADAGLRAAVSAAAAQGTAADQQHTAGQCLARVAALAGPLAGIGAIPEPAAASALDNLAAELVQRKLLPPVELDDERAAPGPSREPDAVRAVPAGVGVECEIDGFAFPFRVRLSALVTDGQRGRLTFRTLYTDPQLTGPQAWRQGPDARAVLRGITAADDLGGQYDGWLGMLHGGHSQAGSGGTSFREAGWCWLDPAPPDAARWLEVTLAGRAPVRIGLDRAPEPAITVAALDPAGTADRYLDARSVTLLTGDPEMPGRSRSADVVTMAADLLGAGALQPASPSLARLAAVAARHGLALPGPLAAIGPAPLPADWVAAAERAGRGASGVIFPAAVLPEVEGVRCVITELASRPDITTLRVFAPAWPLAEHGTVPLHGHPQHDDRYRWHAADDLGNGYAVTAYLGAGSVNGAEFPLRLHPPVSPRAGELEITLSGRAEQSSVRVPLGWQHDDWESDQPEWQQPGE